MSNGVLQFRDPAGDLHEVPYTVSSVRIDDRTIVLTFPDVPGEAAGIPFSLRELLEKGWALELHAGGSSVDS